MNKSNPLRLEEQQDKVQKINPFLWFGYQAEEAVKFYVSIFKNSKIGITTRYGKEGYEIHKMEE